MDLDKATPTEANSLQEDEDVCIIVTESNSKNNKQKPEKLTKQISLMQAFQGKGATTQALEVQFKPRFQIGPKRYLVEPPKYIRQNQNRRRMRKRKKGDQAKPDRLDGQYMHWDNLVVAMVFEKAKQLDHRGGFSTSKAIKWFQNQFPQIENFKKLGESTVRAWRKNGIYRKIRGRKAVDEERKAMVRDWLDDIIRPNEVCVPTTINFVWSTVQAKLNRLRSDENEAGRDEPEILKGWKMSKTWFKKFLYKDLGLSLRQATTGRDVPDNWKELKVSFCDRLAIRAREFNITPDLVVNADQTGWHLAPHRGKTLAQRGARSISMISHNDKRQVTMMVALTASGEMLPLQFVFKGKTDKVKGKAHLHYTAKHDWLFSTNPDTHWASLNTMKEWVGKVLHPYFCQKLVEKHLLKPFSGKSVKGGDIEQRCVLIIDCWKVHISKAFTTWMKKNYPYILLLFVPARCTSKLQVVDLVGNYKLKALAVKEFEKYLLENLQQQISENEKRISRNERPIQYTLDLKMMTLRDKVPEWAEKGFDWFQTDEGRALILSGWKSCGLNESFSSLYQVQALERMFEAMNMDESKRREWELFNCTQKDLGKITDESASRWEDKVNEMDDIDQDQDEPAMVEESPEGGKRPNAMQADSQDDFGMWTRFCAFATQHIRQQLIDGDVIEHHEEKSDLNENKTDKGENVDQQRRKRKRGRPRKLPMTIVEDVEEEEGDTVCQVVEDVFDEDEDNQSDTEEEEDAYSVHDTDESEGESEDASEHIEEVHQA